MKHNLKDKIYYLKDGSEPISFVLQSRSGKRSPLIYFDEAKQVNRALRYARNQKSPFEDEQDEHAIVEPIVFENGELRVDKTNVVLQKFLELHPGNNKIFIEFDPEREAKKDLEMFDQEVEALIAAKEMSIAQCEDFLRAIGGNNVDTMTSQEVRRDVRVYARTNPYEFLVLTGDPSVRMRSNISKFFEAKMLQTRNSGKDIYFNLPNDKKKLATLPEDTTKEDFLYEYFTSEDNHPAYSRLLNEL